MQVRLGVVASHPIQYQAPWFRHLAGELADLEVFYAHRQGGMGQAAAGHGVEFEWDLPLLEGYRHRWLENVASRPGLSTFSGCDTPEIREVVRSGRFDAFLVLGWNRKSFIQAVTACWRHRVPVLMRGDSRLPSLSLGSALKGAAKWLPYRALLPRLDAHLVVGQRNRRYLEHFGVPTGRLFFAPHFVDVERFAATAADARAAGAGQDLRRAFALDPETFLVAFCGRFVSFKRIDTLIRALARLAKEEPGRPVAAVLVGDGPLRGEIESLARETRAPVHFLGFTNQSELPRIYAGADALVLPSDARETWGLVVNEAMAAGRPAIVADEVGCAPDMIDLGETGFRFPCGDSRRLARAVMDLRELIARQPDRVRRAVAAKSARYSVEVATSGLLEALEKITDRRPGRGDG